ncbi:hypothetical protein DSECCO2_221470 [anaerobic digester metagenome]
MIRKFGGAAGVDIQTAGLDLGIGKNIEEVGGMSLESTLNIGGSVTALCADDTYLYVASEADYNIRKYKKSDMSFVASMAGRADAYAAAMIVINGFLLIAFNISPTTIWKVNPTTMTKVGESASITSSYYRFEFCSDGTYLYESGGGLNKIDVNTMSIIASNSNYDDCKHLSFQGGKVYGCSGYSVLEFNTSTLAVIRNSASLGAYTVGAALIGVYLYALLNSGVVYKLNVSNLTTVSSTGDANTYAYKTAKNILSIENSLFILSEGGYFGSGIQKVTNLNTFVPSSVIPSYVGITTGGPLSNVIFDGKYIFASGNSRRWAYGYCNYIFKINPKVYKEK